MPVRRRAPKGCWLSGLQLPMSFFSKIIKPERQQQNAKLFLRELLARISPQLSIAAADPGMSTALRSVGLLDVLSSTPAEPSVARLVSMPVCAASLRNLVRIVG